MSVTSCRLPFDGVDLRLMGVPDLNPESNEALEYWCG